MFDIFQKQTNDAEKSDAEDFTQNTAIKAPDSSPLAAPAPVTPAAKAGIVTVDTFFHGKTYEIPSYQREFTWGEPQVKALLGDLVEAFDTRIALSAQPQYFLGALVTQVRERNEDGETDLADKIVDGQQRITSLMIILAVLCKQLASSDGKPGIWDEEQKRLLGLIFRDDLDHFMLDVSGYNYYLRALMGGKDALPDKLPGHPPFKTTALQKFSKAFDLFEQGILEEIGDVDLKSNLDDENQPNLYNLAHFSKWLTDGVFMALIQDTDPYDDQRLFDRMNTRGLPLSESERFKSRVLSSAKLESSKQASKLWQKNQDFAVQALNTAKQRGSLAIRDSREAERRLLGGWIIASQLDIDHIDGATIKLARQIELDPYDYCLNTLDPETDRTRPSQLFNLLKSKFFRYVQKAKSKNAYLGVYKFVPEQAGLQHAQITKLPFLDAAIAACFAATPVNRHKRRLSALAGFLDILAFHSIWNQRSISSARLKETVLAATHTIMTSQVSDLRRDLARLLGPLPHIDAGHAPSLTSSNQRWIRYILGRMAYGLDARALNSRPPTEYINGVGNRAPEIEHIFSKRYYDDGATFGFRRDEIEAYRQKLGGLTLLAREENREASNKSWEERTIIYESSNLLTQTLLRTTFGNELQIKRASNDVSLLQFQPWEKISPEAIDDRTKAYTNLAREIWSTGTFLSSG